MDEEEQHNFETYLHLFEGDPPPGKYAMWWPTSEEPRFFDSPLRKVIQESLEALDGIEPFVAMWILEKLTEERLEGMVELPSGIATEVLYKEGTPPFLLSFSQEKAIRLHFHEELCSARQRYEIWSSFCDYVKIIKRVTDRINKSKKTILQRLQTSVHNKTTKKSNTGALGWWESIDKISAKHDPEGIGVIQIDPQAI
jgi:hypothetical protein